jgi:hypothetical protein
MHFLAARAAAIADEWRAESATAGDAPRQKRSAHPVTRAAQQLQKYINTSSLRQLFSGCCSQTQTYSIPQLLGSIIDGIVCVSSAPFVFLSVWSEGKILTLELFI